MPKSSSSSPFAGAAAYYHPFRPPYPPAAIQHIVDAFDLGPGVRALDLGCGPGVLAIPLSFAGAEVVAVDPDAGMIAEGRRLAASGGRKNIRWLRSRAEDLSLDLPPFRAATLGQSFHWMDRDLVLRNLAELIEDGGGLALVNPGQRRPQESWEATADQVVTRFLGPRRSHPGANPLEPDHAPALRRSECFSEFMVREFPGQTTRDVASIIGCVYSNSRSTRPLFGADAPAFEAALSQALLGLNPSGRFHERLETEVIIAPKQPR